MKAVAAALVLIIGAAVVLWYGNTLNSWVLGGLVGGLAALLLSIPISLTLFSYLSRRHEERLYAEAEAQEREAWELAQAYEDGYYAPEELPPPRVARRTYVRESHLTAAEEAQLDEDEEYKYAQYQYEQYQQQQQQYASRRLPAPSSQRLPATRQGQHPTRVSASLNGNNAPAPKQQTRNVPVVSAKDGTGHRTTRRAYPGFMGYEPGSFHSRQRSAALRVARQEAADLYDDVDVEMFPKNVPRRLPSSTRMNQPLHEQQRGERPQRGPRQSRRVVDSTPPQTGMYEEEASNVPMSWNDALSSVQQGDPQTEYFLNTGERHPQTGPMRSTRGGHPTRNPQVERRPFDPDVTTDSLKRPLVRRAPYSYQDDSLHLDLPQQANTPIVRRSSLRQQDEE